MDRKMVISNSSAARNPLLDILKGYAIFLVIWGHAIQCLGEGMAVLSQPIGKFIYMFHMPLFFFISGYVAVRALSMDFRALLQSRLRSLFLPLCIWTLLSWLVKIGLNVTVLPDSAGMSAYGRSYLSELISAYWFIWALLLCIFYARIIRYIKVWQPALLCLSALALLALPDLPLIGDLNAFRAMYPFFIGGYLFRQYNIIELISRHKVRNLIAWGGVFVLCFVVCKSSYFIYTVRFNLWFSDWLYVMYHYFYIILAGFSGIILSFFGFKWLMNYYSFPSLCKIGRYTLSIYFVQGIFFNAVLVAYPVHLSSQPLYLLSAIIITILCWGLAAFIARFRYPSLLLLGKS